MPGAQVDGSDRPEDSQRLSSLSPVKAIHQRSESAGAAEGDKGITSLSLPSTGVFENIAVKKVARAHLLRMFNPMSLFPLASLRSYRSGIGRGSVYAYRIRYFCTVNNFCFRVTFKMTSVPWGHLSSSGNDDEQRVLKVCRCNESFTFRAPH
ncbi:hypothetical protein MG293_012810 [Ovis ammon polii]|uniref:Uncharacterized protein n=1 Tax=Ovis ammon polii TaxID=230172 RepID=A0AAD4Y6V4_OVIAM|nr:hypothetical protein MG293_012810 [Ovis ammon polii]